MLQVIQNFKSGELIVEDVPPPALRAGGILVGTMFSLISAGTERTTVETARKSLLGKARSRPDLVRRVLDTARRDGLLKTIQLVKNKLETSLPLGYSSSGVVLAVAEDVTEFAVGDRVACGGQGYASHAEVVFVPRNLAVKVPPSVPMDDAAYTTLGAIAMQGIRQAQAAVGDKVVVIGLGLLGLLTVQILKAGGCTVIGTDIAPDACERAAACGADVAFNPSESYEPLLEQYTDGRGADCAIVTAASRSNEPILLGGEILRDKGTLVIVGAVPADIPRSPFYEKEIDVRFSRSYGPGRYDPTYEELGIDYPFGYVRWTENRNMSSFVDLMADGRVVLKDITTHRIPIQEALTAYDLITNKTPERYLGVLLTYEDTPKRRQAKVLTVRPEEGPGTPLGAVAVGFLGAGNFAQNYLLPILKKDKRVHLATVATSRGLTAKSVAKKFRFVSAASDVQEITSNPDISCVFITTRHNLHAPFVADCLRAGKTVFVEKPLALNPTQLKELVRTYNERPGKVMIGFNRRFSSSVREVKKFFARKIQPSVVTYRINAGFVPKEHWTQDPTEGGGRIIGEVCHFVDLMTYLVDSVPIKVYAEVISSTRDDMVNKDNVSIVIKYRDGSVGTIVYAASGDRTFPKERIEMFCENSVAVIDDFRKATLTRSGRTKTFGGSRQDKGHKAMLGAFIEALSLGQPIPIAFQDAVNATIVTFRILDSLSEGRAVQVRLDDRQEVLDEIGRIYTDSVLTKS